MRESDEVGITFLDVVLVRLGSVQRAALPDLLERAWREVAPARLIKEFDARP